MKSHYKKLHLLLLALLMLFTVSCKKAGNQSVKSPETITVFAAAGTRIVTEDVCSLYSQKTSVLAEKNFASSGTLARQIANGAKADIFISANKKWIDFLNNKGLLKNGSVKQIASNSLALIAPVGKDFSALSFTKDFDITQTVSHKIAIGDPSYVPVGNYSMQFLKNLGWDELLKTKMVLAKDVSSVLHYVELGECDWGVVYYTEALLSDKVAVISTVPKELHKPIRFYIALSTEASEASTALYDFFLGNDGTEIFEHYGFNKNL